MKYPKVNVTIRDQGYEAKVAVYRHVTTPNEINVVILAIRPIPPLPMVDDPLGVAKVIAGQMVSFDIEKTYPN